MNESKALLRYLGTLHKYYPTDPKEAWQADALLDYIPTVMEKLNPRFI